MSVPPEVAWIVPIVVPFIIGLLVGAAIKRALKLMMVIVAIVIVLVATGAVSLTFRDIYDQALKLLPTLKELGGGILGVLPYSSVAFLIGLALGLWRG